MHEQLTKFCSKCVHSNLYYIQYSIHANMEWLCASKYGISELTKI